MNRVSAVAHGEKPFLELLGRGTKGGLLRQTLGDEAFEGPWNLRRETRQR